MGQRKKQVFEFGKMDEKVESSQKNKNLNHENVVMKDQIQKN
jgi:hypothetical protein